MSLKTTNNKYVNKTRSLIDMKLFNPPTGVARKIIEVFIIIGFG